MKKNNFTLLLFLFIGLIAGLIGGILIEPLAYLSFLTKSVELSWDPKADLKVFTYDFHLMIRVNLMSLLGVIGGYFLYQKV
jgi:hypothetical protein